MMKTILDKSGKVLFSTHENYICSKDELFTDLQLTDFMLNPYFNFETNTFYENASQDELIEAKNEKEIQLKKEAYEQLLETDWYVTRFIETGKAIPSNILELRQRIREQA